MSGLPGGSFTFFLLPLKPEDHKADLRIASGRVPELRFPFITATTFELLASDGGGTAFWFVPGNCFTYGNKACS